MSPHEAAMSQMGCAPAGRPASHCWAHPTSAWTVDGCRYAADVAAAVVTAERARLAKTLTQAAETAERIAGKKGASTDLFRSIAQEIR